MDAFAFLAVPAIAVALIGLALFGRQQYRSNPPRFYRFAGGVIVLILSALPFVRSAVENSFLWGVIVGPALAVSAVQIPLAAFDNPRSTRWPIGLLVASIVLTAMYLVEPAQNGEWFEESVTALGMVGLAPLMASAWRLMTADSQSDQSSTRSIRRFLFWLALTLGPLLVRSTIESGDRLRVIGEALFAIGGLAVLGTVARMSITLARRRVPNPGTLTRTTLVLLASAAIALAGILMAGDAIRDRHASIQAARTWSDRLFGCGDSRQFTQVVTDYASRLEANLAGTLGAPVLPMEVIPRTNVLDPELQAAFALANASAFAYLSCADMLEATQRWNRPGLRAVPLGFGVSLSAETGAVLNCPRDTPSRDEGVILADHRDVVIAFRGTDGWLDAKSDLNAIPTHLITPEWVHSGFADSWARIRTETIARLRQVRDRDQTLWITGHSLGGAIAVLAADDLQRAGMPIHAVYTFGQPRVAGAALARAIDQRLPRIYRFVLLDDGVPAAGPPTAVSVGHLRYIDSTGHVHDDPNDLRRIQDQRCSGAFNPITSHGKAGYVSALLYAGARSRAQQRAAP